MKSFIDMTKEEKVRLLRWAMKKGRFDMWNDKGVFISSKAAYWIFKYGLEAAEKEYEKE